MPWRGGILLMPSFPDEAASTLYSPRDIYERKARQVCAEVDAILSSDEDEGIFGFKVWEGVDRWLCYEGGFYERLRALKHPQTLLHAGLRQRRREVKNG